MPIARTSASCNDASQASTLQVSTIAHAAAQTSVILWAATGTGWLQMESRAKKISVAVLFLIPLALLMVRKLLGVEGYVPDLLLYVAAFTLLQSQRHAARVSLIVPRFVWTELSAGRSSCVPVVVS